MFIHWGEQVWHWNMKRWTLESISAEQPRFSMLLHLLIDFKQRLGIYVLEQGQDLTQEQMSE